MKVTIYSGSAFSDSAIYTARRPPSTFVPETYFRPWVPPASTRTRSDSATYTPMATRRPLITPVPTTYSRPCPPPSYTSDDTSPTYSQALIERLKSQYNQMKARCRVHVLARDIVHAWMNCLSTPEENGSWKRAHADLVMEKMLSELKKAHGDYNFDEWVESVVDLVVRKNDVGKLRVVVDGYEVCINMAEVFRTLLDKKA